ncbi:MAG: hypothetical protein DCF32_19170, partial [Leptolyngbya sp.]
FSVPATEPLTLELFMQQSPLREQTQLAMGAWRSLIERIVTKGVIRGELQPTVEAATVATILIATIEGGIMLSKLYDDPDHLDRALDHLKTYVQQQLAILS